MNKLVTIDCFYTDKHYLEESEPETLDRDSGEALNHDLFWEDYASSPPRLDYPTIAPDYSYVVGAVRNSGGIKASVTYDTPEETRRSIVFRSLEDMFFDSLPHRGRLRWSELQKTMKIYPVSRLPLYSPVYADTPPSSQFIMLSKLWSIFQRLTSLYRILRGP